MARNKAVSIPASRGMDASSDSAALAPDMAQQLTNLLYDRAGVLRSNVSAINLLSPGLPFAIDGIAWYYGATPAADRLLFVAGGWLYAAAPANIPPSYPPAFLPPQAVPYTGPLSGPAFAIGKVIRSAAFEQETILVQDGGIQPLRFDGTNLFQLGISAPAAPSVVAFGSGNVTGNENYSLTYFDSKFRESSPSLETAVAASAQQVQVTVNYGNDPQVVGAYIYRRLPGTTSRLRLATILKPRLAYTDNLADASVPTSVLAPNPGENDPPAPASCVTVHKNYVFLNNTTNPQQLQVSNLSAPTQWASISIVPTPATDGAQFIAATDQGDQINALIPFGSLLGIVKRRNIYLLWGDTVSDFVVRAIHARGSSAPNSMVRADNALFGFLDDGIYALDYQSAFLVGKTSKPIESLLQGYVTGGWSSVESAWGAFVNNKYLTNIGGTIFVYDFDTQGWGELGFSLTQGTTVTERNAAPVLYASTATGQIVLLDLYRQASVTGAVWRTRAFSFGQQEGKETRTSQGTVVRIRVFGEGTLLGSSTMTLTLDNSNTIVYPFYPPFGETSDILWIQGFDSQATGYIADVTLKMDGSNIVIRGIEVEYYSLN